MAKKLIRSVESKLKRKPVPGIVLEVVGSRCTVQLSTTGRRLHGIKWLGAAPTAGDSVLVDFVIATAPTVIQTIPLKIASTNVSTVANTPVPPSAAYSPASEPTSQSVTDHSGLSNMQGGEDATPEHPSAYYHLTESEWWFVQDVVRKGGMAYLRAIVNSRGDMLKSVYDTNNDGVVEHALTTDQIRGKDIDSGLSPSDGQALVWDAALNKWKAGTVATGGGGGSSSGGAGSTFLNVPIPIKGTYPVIKGFVTIPTPESMPVYQPGTFPVIDGFVTIPAVNQSYAGVPVGLKLFLAANFV